MDELGQVLKEIKEATNGENSMLKPLEKDLDSPIGLDRDPMMECVETPNENVSNDLLPEEELNRPISDNIEPEDMGLSEEVKAEIIENTDWSEATIDSIKSDKEAAVYLEANLKEVNGNLERTDIDWDAKIPEDKIDRMRSLYGDEVADKWANKTNLDLIKEGKAPYGRDGERINLHHIGQKTDSPLAELTDSEHKQYDAVLHDKTKTSEIERPMFKSERCQYWKARYESLKNN